MLRLCLSAVAGLFTALCLPDNPHFINRNVMQATSPRSTNCTYLVHFKKGGAIESSSVEKWIMRYTSAFGVNGTIRVTGMEEAAEAHDSSFRLAKLRSLQLRQHLRNLGYPKQQISTFFYNKTVASGSVGYLEYCLAPQCFCSELESNSRAANLRNQVEFDPEHPG
jgi:hypothetical protein